MSAAAGVGTRTTMFSIPCSVSRLGLLGAIAVAGASVLTDAMAVVLVSGASAGVGGETMAGGWRLAAVAVAVAVAACSRLKVKGPLPVALPQ